MSQARVQNFTVSLDGFGTGEPQSVESPFGHAGQRLHEWMMATRYFHGLRGDPGGTAGIDDAFARQFPHGIGADYEVEMTPSPSGVTHLTFTRSGA